MSETTASGPPRRTPTFAAVIAHADDAEMLRRCITHHLRIGVDVVFVALNLDDAASAAVPAEFAEANVRAERLETFAPDPFDYFTAAHHAVTAWAAPDWVLFVDSDEFWVPAGGSIRAIAGLERTDVFSVRRFNIAPVRGRDGAVRDVDLFDTHATLVVGERHTMDATFLAEHPDTPWISAKIGPKVMARAELVETVAIGAHDIVARVAGLRTTIPADLLILHLPFTTQPRFLRKIEGIRGMLTRHADRYTGSLAWHWRRWVAVADAGGVDAEFAAQLVDEADLMQLVERGVLTTPARLFAEGRLGCA